MRHETKNTVNKGKSQRKPRLTMACPRLSNQTGFALVTAIIISFAVFSLIIGILYFATKSTTMSGAGKRYATACQAADGAIEMMKDGLMHSDSLPPGFPTACDEGYAFTYAVGLPSTACTMNITSLQGTVLGTTYQATAKIYMAASYVQPGYRIEFPPRGYAGGSSGIAKIFRINMKVTGPDNAGCENSVLFRYF
jgi:hypothetical protein